jgi:mono/diheme cytochrome c family protein
VPTRVRTNSVVYPAVTGVPTLPAIKPAATNPDALKFDAKEKVVNVKSGELEAKFAFAVTNVSKEDAIIMSVHTSCGCTAAKLPSTPWILKPGDGGEIAVTMNLAGKFGTVTKTVTVVTSSGSIPLFVKSILPQDAYQNLQRMTERSRNLQIAAADRQAVFRGDCAKCHVEAGVGKKGHDLYAASCGVCHDAEHRATMVPILRGRPGTFAKDYWANWVRNGKDGSLMPAFDTRKGGPLTDEQIDSLVDYLAGEFPAEPVPKHLVLPAPVVPTIVKPATLPNGKPAAAATPAGAQKL